MMLFANILLLALSIVAPQEGAIVPLLRGSHKAYLEAKRSDRFKAMEKAELRQAMVSRGSTQCPVKLEWEGPTNVVYNLAIARVGIGGERQSYAIPYRTCAYVTNLELGERYLWLVTVAGTAERVHATFWTEPLPPRLLRADGVFNLRDLGGWKGLNGRKVKQNMIFRSAGLRFSAKRHGGSLFGGRYEPGGDRITPEGIKTLRDELKIRTDIELRNNQEAACMTSSILGEDVKWVHVPFAAYDFIDNPVRGREPFLKLFRTFIDEKNYPILFHCSGGRDRTGTLALLLNGLLGVSGEDLCRDWEATVFAEESVKFGPDRIQRLLTYLTDVGGDSLAEQCERYAISCGVTKREIEKFRGIMLEGGN